MIAWTLRALLLALVAGGWAVGWHAGDAVAASLSPSRDVATGVRHPDVSGLTGAALRDRVSRDLAAIDAARDEHARDADSGVVVVDSVDFDRSAGAVVARGRISDLAAPRDLNAVIDAFDASGGYMASGSSPVSSAAGATAFSVSLPDRDSYTSFAVRFLDDGMSEVASRSPGAPVKRVAPLMADDALHAADLTEVASRLAAAGYGTIDARAAGDDVVLAWVRRFRADRGIDGPSIVSIGDLVALRAATPPMRTTADFGRY